MAEDRARRFIDALHRLEEDRDPDPIAELFADDARLRNPVHEMRERGRDGARHFWRTYRDTFDEIRSEFRNVVESDGAVALEWYSHGRTSNGRECEYDGVSILEYDEDDEGIRAFRAYFDPGKLGIQLRPGGPGRAARGGSGGATGAAGRPDRPRPATDSPTG
ncbi:MAG: nuclear transport factor 2 family protein [Gemmatimonadota bacterium]